MAARPRRGGHRLQPFSADFTALFVQLGLEGRLQHILGDVRDLAALAKVVRDAEPEFVFHLAAQPIVRTSYAQPVETYATNVMGTVNLLEAVRLADRPCSVVVITTDKCYENREWVHSYREEDALGGYDPYSSSKGCAELVVSAYRRSYFSGKDSRVHVASARAGNVIGGVTGLLIELCLTVFVRSRLGNRSSCETSMLHAPGSMFLSR